MRILKYLLKNLKMFFCPQKVEKTTPKSCILMAVGRFSAAQNSPEQPRTSFPFYKFFYPTISGRISGSRAALLKCSDNRSNLVLRLFCSATKNKSMMTPSQHRFMTAVENILGHFKTSVQTRAYVMGRMRYW